MHGAMAERSGLFSSVRWSTLDRGIVGLHCGNSVLVGMFSAHCLVTHRHMLTPILSLTPTEYPPVINNHSQAPAHRLCAGGALPPSPEGASGADAGGLGIRPFPSPTGWRSSRPPPHRSRISSTSGVLLMQSPLPAEVSVCQPSSPRSYIFEGFFGGRKTSSH